MRVAIIVRTLKIGGMERVAISLAKAFYDEGHDSHLIYFKNKKNTLTVNKEIKLHHFNLDKIITLSIVGFFWELFSRITNIFLRKSYPLIKGLLSSQIFKIKLLMLEREYGKFDLIILRGQGTLEMIYKNNDPRIIMVAENIFSYGSICSLLKFQIRAYYENRNIACVSNGVVQSFQDLEIKEDFRSKKICKITNPIDTKQTQQLADAYIPDYDKRFILSVGRIVPAKNIPLLIKAYAYARSHYNVTHNLVIVGEGSELKNVKDTISSLSLERYVHFTGVLDNPFPWMKKADLFILSSKFEGLGMVLLESMACGTKVVATKSEGGVIDIMNNELENYLAEQTPQDLAHKIFTTLNDNSNINFQTHLNNFLPHSIVSNYIKEFSIVP